MRELGFFAPPVGVLGSLAIMHLPQGWAEVSALVCWMGAGVLLGLSVPKERDK